MKFITMEDESGNESLFVFPKTINHDAMAKSLSAIKNKTDGNWRRVRRMPISAGFIDSEGNCYGHSNTLGLGSREKDTILFKSQIGTFI